MFFSNSCKSKMGKLTSLVLTDWNLEPSAYTRIEGKIWKCKVAPKHNVFFQKGLNRHAYIHIYILYIYIFLNSWNHKKWENCLILVLTCFSQNSCKSKNGENWLVLVLTDWNLEPSAYTRIEGKIWKCTVAPKNNVFFQKGLNGHAYIHIYIYIIIYTYFSTPGIQKMGKLTKFGVDSFFLKLLESKTWGKLISFGVDMFFSNSWSPKMGKID